MKEPKRIPLTDNPKNKEPEKRRLSSSTDKIEDENNKQDDKTSISELDSLQGD